MDIDDDETTSMMSGSFHQSQSYLPFPLITPNSHGVNHNQGEELLTMQDEKPVFMTPGKPEMKDPFMFDDDDADRDEEDDKGKMDMDGVESKQPPGMSGKNSKRFLSIPSLSLHSNCSWLSLSSHSLISLSKMSLGNSSTHSVSKVKQKASKPREKNKRSRMISILPRLSSWRNQKSNKSND